MSESNNVCTSCGICCDGTLIGFVQLHSEELSAMRQLMDIEEADGKGFLLHPCNKLTCNGCSIYSQRPKECSNYKCEVLKSFEKKELSFDMAIEVINLVKQKKIAIEKQLAELEIELQAKSFFFKMLELKKLFRKDKSEIFLTQKHVELKSDIKELNTLLSTRFGVSF